MEYCEEHDLGTYTRCLLSCRTTLQQHRGQWDEALAVSLRLLEGTETSPQNRMPLFLQLRGQALGRPSA